jgi:hypothetical protein
LRAAQARNTVGPRAVAPSAAAIKGFPEVQRACIEAVRSTEPSGSVFVRISRQKIQGFA